MAQTTSRETELPILHVRIISNDGRERESGITLAGLRTALGLASQPDSKALIFEGFIGSDLLRLTIDVDAKKIILSHPLDELLGTEPVEDPQAIEIATAEARYQLEERFFPDRQVTPKWYEDNWGLGEDAAKDASHWNPWYLHHLWKQGKKPPLAEKYNEEVTQALERLPKRQPVT